MRSFASCFALALVAGCSPHSGTAIDSAPLIVGAPSSLRAPFEEIVRAYQARKPDRAASLMFGPVAELVASGVPFDLIATDDAEALAPIGARLGERRDFAMNPLVLVARAASPPATWRTLGNATWVEHLALADGRGDATGQLAEAALGRLGLRRILDGKLLYTAHAEQSLERLARGDAQLALVRASDLLGHDGLQIADRDDGARYPIALLAASPRAAAARDFLDEVLHGDGPAAFAKAGLLPPR